MGFLRHFCRRDSLSDCLLFCVFNLIGLAILIQFNGFTIIVGISALVLVVAYPFMKRITYWPQAWLGLTFNWGALVGWSAMMGEISMPAVLLYAAGVFWTLGYDTIYAHQDKSDDVIIGVKSTALKFGAHSKPWISSFYAISLSLICISGSIVDLAWPFYVGITICALQLAWQVKTLDIDDPKNCLKRFKSNRDFGLILFASIIAAHLI